jgi:ADP-heptose:LPS heptosyltransferase
VFSDEYSIEWGKHKWIDVEKDEKWSNKVLVNQPVYRFENVDYQKLYNKYGDRLVFIAFKETNYCDYENFVEKTGINIEYYNPTSVYDVAVAINSCELFIGTASGFMAMAISIKAPVVYLCNSSDIMSGNMHTILNNVQYFDTAFQE